MSKLTELEYVGLSKDWADNASNSTGPRAAQAEMSGYRNHSLTPPNRPFTRLKCCYRATDVDGVQKPWNQSTD